MGYTIKIAITLGKKIGDIVREKRSDHHRRPINQVYSIPCSGCEKDYREAAFIHSTNFNTAISSHELAKVIAHLITNVT